jgi:imidazolonepropionase-like amidohydrolase
MPRFAIRAARLLDGTGATATADPLVVVEDGTIVAVEDAARLGDPGCPVVDAPGATLLPGLVDAHTHLWFSGPEVPIDLDRVLLGSAERAALTLAGGVTTARDLGGPGDAALRLRRAIAERLAPGPRLVVSGPPLTTPDGHCHWFGTHGRTEEEVRRAVGDLAAMDVDCLKLMLTGGMSTPTTDPYAPQYPPPVARAAVDEAHRLGLPVAAHALGTPGVRAALAAGVDTLEHGWTITGREQRYDPDVVPAIAATPIVASVTAHHALRELLPGAPDGGEDLVELRRRLVPHRAVLAAGVPVVVHSDTGPEVTRSEGFGESVMVFVLGMDVPVAAAVHAATLLPARALGLDAWLGSVRPGRLADLVTLDGDPERDLEAFRRVRDVWLGGARVAHRGRLVAGG